MEKKRIQSAKLRALEYFDCILETRPAKGFVEIVGRIGGEVLTFRFHDNGVVSHQGMQIFLSDESVDLEVL